MIIPTQTLGVRPTGRWFSRPWFWIGLFVLIRLISIGFPDLLVEEAYYWQYANHLAPGYIDHPPLVAVLIHLGTAIFGHNEFGVRISGVVCWLIAAWFIFHLTRAIFSHAAALGALVAFGALPFFFGATWMMTPDAPLVACWSGALYFLHRALVLGHTGAWWAVGLCMGLGMLSKYTIALLGLATGIYMLLDPVARRQFLSPRPYLAAALAAIVFSPVIYWNITHEWASFAFQGARRFEEEREFYLHMILLDMLVILTPVGVAAVWRGFKRAPFPFHPPSSRLFLTVTTFVPVLVFVFFSLRHETRINWTGPAFLGALPVLGYSFAEAAKLPRFIALGWRITLPVLALTYTLALTYIGPTIPGVPYSKKLHKFVAWDDLAAKLNVRAREIKAETGETPIVVGMDKHYVASELAFYTEKLSRNDPQALPLGVEGRNLFGQPSLMYRFWSPPAEVMGKTLILVSRTRSDLEFPEIAAQTAAMGPIEEVTKERGGQGVGRYYLRVVRDYRPPAGPPEM
jgi:dolichol-phosphate mannosyltransferase